MKIAIYGDSHGDCNYHRWQRHAPHIGLGWPEILSKYHTVENFSEGGTGLWYSFVKFLENNQKFDLNIFLPSQNTRFSIYLPESKKTLHMVPGWQDGMNIRSKKIRKDTPIDNSILEAAAGYVDHILDYKKEEYTGKLLIKEIHNIRPNTIIIDCFREFVSYVSIDFEPIVLCDLNDMELRHWGHHWHWFRTRARAKSNMIEDFRKCHLADENNEMIAKKILGCIENNENVVRLTKADFVPPSKPITHYIFERKDRRLEND